MDAVTLVRSCGGVYAGQMGVKRELLLHLARNTTTLYKTCQMQFSEYEKRRHDRVVNNKH